MIIRTIEKVPLMSLVEHPDKLSVGNPILIEINNAYRLVDQYENTKIFGRVQLSEEDGPSYIQPNIIAFYIDHLYVDQGLNSLCGNINVIDTECGKVVAIIIDNKMKYNLVPYVELESKNFKTIGIKRIKFVTMVSIVK